MGGASSHDIQDGILNPDDPDFERELRQLNAAGKLFRVDHHSWWKEELPSEEEYQIAKETLDSGLGCRLHHNPLLSQQHPGHIQRRAVPAGRTDRLPR